MTKERVFAREYAIFVDDLGGLLWSAKMIDKVTWEEMAREVHCAPSTLRKLAGRITKNPTLYTCWRILKGLDHASVIRHSQLERYRGISKPTKPPKSAKVIPLKREAAA